MSGKSKSTTTTNQSNSFDPWVTNYGRSIVGEAGQQVAENPWQSYAGPSAADFGSTWDQSKGYLSNMLGQIDPNTQAASTNATAFMGSLDPSKTVQDYMSPYTEQVLSPTLRNINEAARDKNAALGAESAMAGAFGDSASGVQRALLERDRQRNVGDATAAAYDKAFSSGVSQRDSDLNRYLSGIGAQSTIGQNSFGQQTELAKLLSAIGQGEQAVGQTGIQNDIALNTQNQQAPLQQYMQLAQMLAMIPKNTASQGTSQTSQPDNTAIALLSSLI